ncbi:MAG: NADH-quinone oxidoreductase subunit I [Ignavibacteria bacterium 13_1_40CM_2_61_4]|nr:MAG: NADH-quinone oxidoreductase subunit I [Ignavibacteria bacterium 13_1_40CM_2_61_4]
MPPAKSASQPKIVHRRDLSFWEKLYFPQIFGGLRITLSQLFKPRFTRQYPEERWNPPASFRGRPVLVEDGGIERCVACGLCARVCPALAIEVQGSETELPKERYPVKFEINMLRCIFCGFCEEVCPEEAIVMSKEYELTFTSQEDGIFGKDKLLMPAEKLKDRIEFLRKNR